MNETEISILKQKISMLQKLLSTSKNTNSKITLKQELDKLTKELDNLTKITKKK